jgi:sialate O-acetylesterase
MRENGSLIRNVLLIAFMCAPMLASAEGSLRLGRPFSDHMVVQQEVPLPVWGKAQPNQQVRATWGSETQKTVADADGNWRLEFVGKDVSREPSTLTVQTGDERLEIGDIVVGEVWICAGQSNMAWPVSSSTSAKETLSGEINPNIRLLNFRGMVQSSTKPYTDDMFEQLEVDKFYSGKWELSTPESVKAFSAVGYYFGEKLQHELGIPIGLINVSTGGSPAETWIRRSALASHPQLKTLVEGKWLENEQLSPWCRRRAAHNLGVEHREESSLPGDSLGPNHSFKPGFMWEAGVAPLVPFQVKGVIWYQGESNAEYPWRVAQHEQLFPLLVSDWRKQWNASDMPFLYVQLSGIERPHWPAFRESQRRMLSQIPNTGMAVSIDVGNPIDVHPREKRTVGQRLASWALAKAYGKSENAYSGPLFKDLKAKGDSVVVTFDQTGSGLRTADGKPLAGFELSADGITFHPADAMIVGIEIRVTSKTISNPRFVRYGWQPYPNPALNLVNSIGLPASPFTTVEDFIVTSAEADGEHSE